MANQKTRAVLTRSRLVNGRFRQAAAGLFLRRRRFHIK